MQRPTLYYKAPEADRTRYLDGFVIGSLESGRFALSEKDGLIDTTTGKAYSFNDTIPKVRTEWTDVDGLNSGSGSFSYIFLKQLIEKPLALPLTAFTDAAMTPKVFVAVDDQDGTLSEESIWIYPDNGIEDADNTGYFYVAGASMYRAKADGKLYSMETGSPVEITVPSGTRHMDLRLDCGVTVSVDLPTTIALTFGKYNAGNVSNPIHFIDGDDTNWAVANLTLGLMPDDTKTERASAADVRIANPTDLGLS